MMRLIDADAYLQKIKKDPLYPLIERYGVEGTIEAMPTIDAEPIRHGHWELIGGYRYIGGYGYQYRCSNCIKCADHRTNYCSFCGAKMVEVNDETN